MFLRVAGGITRNKTERDHIHRVAGTLHKARSLRSRS